MVYILELKINKTKQTKQMSSILVSLFHLFELKTLVMKGTDCQFTGSFNFNYHTITIMSSTTPDRMVVGFMTTYVINAYHH